MNNSNTWVVLVGVPIMVALISSPLWGKQNDGRQPSPTQPQCDAKIDLALRPVSPQGCSTLCGIRGES